MPLITFLFGLVLIVVGVLFKSLSETASLTPLIPAFFGGALILCAAAGAREKWRMHAMHAAVLLALLLIVGSLMPPRGIFSEQASFMKICEGVISLVLGIAYLVMGVRSFIAARRARKSSGNAT